MSITGMWKCNDGGSYYIREVGNEVWWAGLGPNQDWANVFKGTRSGNAVTGKWADVPKGRITKGEGTLTFHVETTDLGNGPLDGERLSLLSAAGEPFGGSKWDLAGTGNALFESSFDPKYATSGLTGGWIGNDGGSYYVRESGTSVWWFGEHPSGKWANVFHGTVANGIITGSWSDVPKGPVAQNGTLSLTFEKQGNLPVQRLDRKAQQGGFSGFVWSRRDASTVLKIGLHRLKCVVETDEEGDDEPYLVVFSADLSGTLPRVKAYRSRVFQGDESVAAGESRSQTLRVWGTRLINNFAQPAPIATPDSTLVLVALVENDSGKPDAVLNAVEASCYASVLSAIQRGDDRSSMVKAVRTSMKGAIEMGAATGGIDMDELVDIEELRLSSADLRNSRAGVVAKTLNLVGDGGRYVAEFHVWPGLG